MQPGSIRALMIEDNPGDARLIELALADAQVTNIDLERSGRLADGLSRLSSERFDLVLLDLSLPDSFGIETFRRVRAEQPDVPIVVLSGLSDERVAVAAVNEGAQDYLIKGRVEPGALARSILYAIERHGRMGRLDRLALDDELTGLRNRRGFTTLGEAWLSADGSKGPVVCAFIDINGMKKINDNLGHKEGDAALVDVAGILRSTLRTSDLIARLGGDEFCALARSDEGDSCDGITRRIARAVDAFNRDAGREYTISLSIGIEVYDPQKHASLDELMIRADEMMYRQKKPSGARPRLLIVDDDPVLRQLAHAIFDAEYQVVTAATGSECCELVHERPNLILLDMRLPDASGTELVQRLRNDPATLRTPIIMMTGTSERSAEVDCLRLGADDFIRKPFDEDVLRSRVHAAIRRADAR